MRTIEIRSSHFSHRPEAPTSRKVAEHRTPFKPVRPDTLERRHAVHSALSSEAAWEKRQREIAEERAFDAALRAQLEGKKTQD